MAKLPGSAWQSRGQGFESPYLHREHAGQALAGASGPSSEIPIPALSPRESGVDFLAGRHRCSSFARDRAMPVRTFSLPFTGLRSHRVHGVGRRAEIARVEVGIGAEVDGRIVAEGSCRSRDGHALLGHEAGGRVPEHVRRRTGWKPGLLDGRLPDPVAPVGESDHRAVRRREIVASERSGTCSFMCAFSSSSTD